MKYGDTLRQRSIPAWQNHNIDYEDIKHFIKENTTPGGKGKAISVPGTGDETAKAFEDELYNILKEQHERLNLFVRSKAGEIHRRLSHLQHQLNRFASQRATAHGSVSVKRLQRYDKIETDVLKVGDEIKSLSRFSGVQQTAFRKLLKKYKKWTGSSELGYRFHNEVLDKPWSFTKTDLAPLVVQYDELLCIVRALYEDRIGPGRRASQRQEQQASSTFSDVQHTVQSGAQVEFDTLLATLPLGADGHNAVYWVHPENLIELQVLILQHARSHVPSRRASSSASGAHTPSKSGTASPNVVCEAWSSNQNTFDYIADDREVYMAQQNSNTLETKEVRQGVVLQSAALHARWTKDGDALVTARNNDNSGAGQLQKVAVRRKQLASFLDPSSSFSARKASVPSVSFEGATDSKPSASKVEHVHQWLSSHKEIKHLATVSSLRSRFFDLPQDASSLLLASLDTSVEMSKGANVDQSTIKARPSADEVSTFPFGVLRVRQEGSRMNGLIQELDQSHLVERVRGFSLEYHAIWQCCHSPDAAAPFWLQLLDKDIRKVPRTPSKRSPNANDYSFHSQSTTPQVSTSTSSEAGPVAVEDPTMSGTTLPDQLTQPHGAIRKKKRGPYAQQKLISQPQQQYWSEYDHPEDSDGENGYVIYIDPNEKSVLDRLWLHIDAFFHHRQAAKPRGLLSPSDLESQSRTGDDSVDSDEDEDENDNGETAPLKRASIPYGTMSEPRSRQSSATQTPSAPPPLFLLPKLTITCLASSVIILVVAFLLAATGRRKLASEVDSGIIFAVASSLVFSIVGVAGMFRHNNVQPRGAQLRRVGWAIAVAVLCVVAVASGGLLAWVIA